MMVRVRERREIDPASRIETVHRLHQRHRCNLHQVLEWLPAVQEAARELLGQAQIGGDQLFPNLRVELLVPVGWPLRQTAVRGRVPDPWSPRMPPPALL